MLEYARLPGCSQPVYTPEIMRISLPCALALLFPTLLPAQDVGQRPAASAVAEDLTAELHKQKRESQVARATVRESEAYREARKDDDREKMNALLADAPPPDLLALGNKALEEAAKYQGDDRALLLVWAAVRTRDDGIVTRVIDEVLEHHLDSIAVIPLLENGLNLSRQLGPDKGKVFLSKFAYESKNDYVRAWAMYKIAERMGRGPNASEEEKAKRGEMMALVEELAAGTELGERINAPRFVEERLQIGMDVPEIVGEDTDGIAFKLSDYRGKVVVLDFWGFW